MTKAALTAMRGKKHDTFITSSSLEAARCSAGGRLGRKGVLIQR